MQIGDEVLVTIKELDIVDEKMKVISLGKPEYLEYVGEHIIVEMRNGEHQVAKESQYRLMDSNDNNNVNMGDLVIPKYKDKNLSHQVFYVVVGKDLNGIKVFDDNGNKKELSYGQVEKADIQHVLSYINNLQHQIHYLRKSFIEALDLIHGDIGSTLDKLNK